MTISSPTYSIGAWTAGDSGVTDTNGTQWGVTSTTGIFDGPDVRLNQSPYPNADGAARARSYRNPLASTITGWAQGTTVAGTAVSRRAFIGLLPGGVQDTLTITDLDGLVLTATVELGAAPKATPADGVNFDWQLTLSAADPYLYGPPATSSTGLPSASGGLDYVTTGGLDYVTTGGLHYGTPGSTGLIQLTNAGTAEAWPLFTVYGPTDANTLTVPGVTNSATGQQLSFFSILNQGDVLAIDSNPRHRSVLLNGVSYRRFLTTAQWFSIPPGASVSVQFTGTSTSSTPLLTASLSAAY